MKRSTLLGIFSTGLILSSMQLHATTYLGNLDSGFGGGIGLGSLTLTDDGTTLSGTFTRGTGNFNNSLVIYIDSTAGGFADTSSFADANDGLRRSISGFDGGANRSTLTFASGFAADYAIALGPQNANFGGVWGLASGGNNSLPFSASANLSPVGTDTALVYNFSLSLASIGITPGSGASFELFGTYISDTGFRSTEAIAGADSGTQGWNPFTQSSFGTYITTAVPEPSSIAMLGMGAIGALTFLRRRK